MLLPERHSRVIGGLSIRAVLVGRASALAGSGASAQTGHASVSTAEDMRVLREHLSAFLAEPERIESLYSEWDFWGDTADRNRAFLRSWPR